MTTNQAGEPVETRRLFPCWEGYTTDKQRDIVIELILNHLKLKAVEMTATKHGSIEIELRPDD